MKVIKKKSKKTYIGNNKQEYHYINYYLELDNGKRIIIKTIDVKDLATLDGVAVYER